MSLIRAPRGRNNCTDLPSRSFHQPDVRCQSESLLDVQLPEYREQFQLPRVEMSDGLVTAVMEQAFLQL